MKKHKKNYTDMLENSIQREKIKDIGQLERTITYFAETSMERKIKRSISVDGMRKEHIWMTKEIKEEIERRETQ